MELYAYKDENLVAFAELCGDKWALYTALCEEENWGRLWTSCGLLTSKDELFAKMLAEMHAHETNEIYGELVDEFNSWRDY